MSEMIERVARAMERMRTPQWTDVEFNIWWNHDPHFCEAVTSWGYFTGTRKERCMFEARAAIEAMLEPTPEMMKALRFYGMLDGDPEEAWEMTIKAAINPSTPLAGS